MRIIAGTLGGRSFNSPHSHRTHPMSDKARGALFNMLGDIAGLSVLDAFAGSGALGFEAVSRGAGSVMCIDNDKPAQQAVTDNIRLLGLGNKIRLAKAAANSWLATNPEERFDLVFCDPPYDDLQPKLLQALALRVKPSGLLALSWPGNLEPPEFPCLEQVKCKNYGDITLAFYRNPA